MNKIRLLLVDDHLVVRCGLRLMLSGSDRIEVCGEAADGESALIALRDGPIDVVLLDLMLPDRSGLDLLRQIREQYPATAVLVLSAHPEDTYAIRALRLGAAGYLNKESCAEVLVSAVHKAASGGKYVSPQLLQKLAGMIGGGSEIDAHERLTDRELAIFRMIAEGKSLVAIAGQLHLSPSTVTTYRARIMEKMRMTSNAEITRYAVDHAMLG